MEPSDAVPNPGGWDEIHGFDSPGEYNRFLVWVSEALDEGALVEVPVLDRYSGSEMFDERWFRAASGQLWRLVAPEPPFRGIFLMIGEADS